MDKPGFLKLKRRHKIREVNGGFKIVRRTRVRRYPGYIIPPTTNPELSAQAQDE